MEKLKWLPDFIKSIIGLVTVLLVFGYLYGITFFGVKLPHDIVPQVLIAIVAFGKDIYNYFFGNSQGSAKKDELLATMSITPTPTATTTNGDINVDSKPKDDAV